MPESETTDELRRMHEAHAAWRSEHQVWCDEMESWRRQQEGAVDDLARLEAALTEARRAIGEHRGRIQAHDEALRRHERELAEMTARCAKERFEPRTVEHQAAAYQHGQEREAHARLKAKHHDLVALVRKLGRTFGA